MVKDCRNVEKVRECEELRLRKAECCKEPKARTCGPWLLKEFQRAAKASERGSRHPKLERVLLNTSCY